MERLVGYRGRTPCVFSLWRRRTNGGRMSIYKDAFIEWQEGLEESLKPELSRQEQIQLQMERLNDCFNNQFEGNEQEDK
jgi:hypothetical protein